MSRPLRIELPGGLYHVTSRGDRQEDIYLSDKDRLTWLALLGNTCNRFNWVCHAYCQMTNHYHLVVETPEANLAQGMRYLNGVYTQYLNRAHQRVGHVFQGRYKAILVEKDSYLLALSRYVVLNPVRAGMVKGASDWAWSSYLAITGVHTSPSWLETDWILSQFSNQRDSAQAAFINFVHAGVGLPSVWRNLQKQIFLGSEPFIARMHSHLPSDKSMTEIPRAQMRPIAKPLHEYQTNYADNPQTGMALAYLTGVYTMKAIAATFGVHYATVSRAIKSYETDK